MGSGGGAWKPIVFLGGTKFRLRSYFGEEFPEPLFLFSLFSIKV